MNILVTGGTGFVSKPLVKALLSRGDSVTVLTRSIEKAHTIFPEKTPQFLTALSIIKTTFIDKKQKGVPFDTPS